MASVSWKDFQNGMELIFTPRLGESPLSAIPQWLKVMGRQVSVLRGWVSAAALPRTTCSLLGGRG